MTTTTTTTTIAMRETRLITADAHSLLHTAQASDDERLPVASNGTADDHKQQENPH
jgi:hypothetical protein